MKDQEIEKQSEMVQIKIKVIKECNTCKHVCFQDDWNTAKCELTNEIVIENYEDLENPMQGGTGHTQRVCLENNIHSIKIDTHKENLSMQKLLKKNNFSYCGIIYLESKAPRVAFEKLF